MDNNDPLNRNRSTINPQPKPLNPNRFPLASPHPHTHRFSHSSTSSTDLPSTALNPRPHHRISGLRKRTRCGQGDSRVGESVRARLFGCIVSLCACALDGLWAGGIAGLLVGGVFREALGQVRLGSSLRAGRWVSFKSMGGPRVLLRNISRRR